MKYRNLFIVAIALIFAVTTNAQDKFEYVGVKTCGMCHKKADDGEQLKIWEASAHANAYKTLQTEEADKIAAEKGFKTKAAETADCLKCHVSGHGVDAKLIGKKFKMEDGVQCETCHGPGSEYKSKKVMENREEAVKNGMLVFEDVDKELCQTCHNEESPTFVKFDYKEMWAKIAHPIPAAK
ncbi:MAG: cytochrome c family protein [Melioribacteraceae bacterium]|nr:cytochrome c family protein [Melioribacteraceae bacterium]MCF8263675.1 cytochrome c family protein [Melioribacteraceae bacterium]MCF8431079.1 cytochrome c family protein [Melioribacteraceae bacterium]